MYKLTDEAKDEMAREIYKINCESARKALAQQIMERLKYNRENNKGGKLC
jgi:hypothetical protein